MKLSRTILLALAATLLATASFAADTPAAPPAQGGQMSSVMGFLTPEERMMSFAEMQKDTAGMTDEQRQAYRQAHRDKIMAMSDAEKQKYAADLKAKWDALPADQKAKIQQDRDAYRASHPMMGQGGGGQ